MRFLRMCMLIVGVSLALGQSRHTGPNDPTLPEGPQKLWVTPPLLLDTSLAGLLKTADFVAEASVENVLPSRQVSAGYIETDMRAAVSMVFKGEPATREIMISQAGGHVGNATIVPQQYDLMMPGERYVFFLVRDARPSTPSVSGVPAYYILGAWTGSFAIVANKIMLSTHSPHDLQIRYDDMDVTSFEAELSKLASQAQSPASPK